MLSIQQIFSFTKKYKKKLVLGIACVQRDNPSGYQITAEIDRIANH